MSYASVAQAAYTYYYCQHDADADMVGSGPVFQYQLWSNCPAGAVSVGACNVPTSFDTCPPTPAGQNDNCPSVANVNQQDSDGDGVGDICDNASYDNDADGFDNAVDNCPSISNVDQMDGDGDANGDACDADDDNDGVSDAADRFPLDATESVDTDNDGVGNNADTDDDGDAVSDGTDNCPLDSNVSQLDTDGDEQGNVCDSDDDNDGIADSADGFSLNAAASSDGDSDGFPGSWNPGCDAACQVASGLTLDNCPQVANSSQSDINGNGIGDACDGDTDGDGVPNDSDAFPNDPAYSADTDSDTLPDDWELANGRDPSVADYVLNTNCVKDDEGTKYWNGGSGTCNPVTALPALVQVYLRTWSTGGVCSGFISRVEIQCTASITSVVCRRDYDSFYPSGSFCSAYTPPYTYSTTTADTLVQFAIVGTGTASGGATYKNYCFLERAGLRCYTGNGSDSFGGAIAAPVVAVFDSDGDGVQRPADSDDLDRLNPWVDSDGDTIHDLADSCPAIHDPDQLNTDGDTQGNACDADDDNDNLPDVMDPLPLQAGFTVDGQYRGSQVREEVSSP